MPTAQETDNIASTDKRGWTYIILLVVLGYIGAHRFYLRKIGTGIIYLLTLSYLGIGVIVDAIRIAKNNVRDAEKTPLQLGKGARISMGIFAVIAILTFFYMVVISAVAAILFLIESSR